METITHQYGESKTYYIEVKIKDSFKEKISKKIKLIVKAVLADFEINPVEGTILTKFYFDASDSKSDTTELVGYLWDITNGE